MYSRPLPPDTPSSIFSEGRGRLYIGYLKRIIWTDKLSVKVDELTDKVRGIVHSHELSVSSMKTAISVINECRARPWVGRTRHSSRVCFCSFTKIIFKLTIDISVRKIILEMEYFIESMIYQMLKFFRRIASFYPKMILRPLFCFEDTKNVSIKCFSKT